jgi:hypothetical protein
MLTLATAAVIPKSLLFSILLCAVNIVLIKPTKQVKKEGQPHNFGKKIGKVLPGFEPGSAEPKPAMLTATP